MAAPVRPDNPSGSAKQLYSFLDSTDRIQNNKGGNHSEGQNLAMHAAFNALDRIENANKQIDNTYKYDLGDNTADAHRANLQQAQKDLSAAKTQYKNSAYDKDTMARFNATSNNR